nr:hypothetical protein [uncultured Merdimonas sp.]
MKRYMKYLAALLFLLSLVVLLFMPVIGISSIDLSMLDVLRAGGELGEGWGGFSQILKEYLQPYFFGIILIIILIVAAALLCAVMPGKMAYVEALVAAFVVNLTAIICMVSLYSKVSDLKQGLGFFGLGGVIEIHILPILFWAVCYLIIFGISIWGILQSSHRSQYQNPAARQIMPESFHQKRNPWEDRRELTEPVKRPGDRKREVQEPPVSSVSYDFHGALKGLEGIYKGKVYLLEEKVPFYLTREGEQVFVAEQKEPGTLVEIYYISEYGEYCVTPEQKGACQLESSQPLGSGRHYYLKRGARIRAGKNGVLFELA